MMPDAPKRVLVVEDEPQIRRFIRHALEQNGVVAIEAGTAAQALASIAHDRPDLILLDLGLPDGDGVELIRDLRLWSRIPVVVVSARSLELQKIEALDAGADDYLTKPFGVAELLARVRAALRRAAADSGSPAMAEFDGIRVDHVARAVYRGEERLHLTPIEYRLLALLLANSGKVLTHRQLLKEVWGSVPEEGTPFLRVHVANLRRKLERDPTRPRHILTETGVGYRFVL